MIFLLTSKLFKRLFLIESLQLLKVALLPSPALLPYGQKYHLEEMPPGRVDKAQGLLFPALPVLGMWPWALGH